MYSYTPSITGNLYTCVIVLFSYFQPYITTLHTTKQNVFGERNFIERQESIVKKGDLK